VLGSATMAEAVESKRSQILIGVLAVLGVVAYFTIGRESRQNAADAVANIEGKVAANARDQYEIAKRQGDAMQTCVQAGFVAAAFLQAKDEGNYRHWKTVEQQDCAKAGVAK